jgi:hypothetical protein
VTQLDSRKDKRVIELQFFLARVNIKALKEEKDQK